MVSPEILRGIVWMILAALLYASAGGVVRLLSPHYSTFELVFFRNLVGLVVLVPLMLRVGRAGLATRRIGMHTTRTLFSWIGTMALFYALARMPIADVGALIFTQPLMSIVLAILVLGQAASTKSWIACLIGFAGALVILRPGFSEVSFAAVVALVSAFTYACATTAIKSLTETESIVAITLYVNLMMLPLSAVAAAFDWKTPSPADLPALFALGLLYTGAQYAIAKGIAAADARIMQPFDFLRLPFAALIGWLLFRELPDGWTWAGALIIFLASTYALRIEAGSRARPAG
jgi:drug/metabolite transporter (DMT)-like permease